MTTGIKFGTDGWRGLIAKDFTFENVARCAQGLADYLIDQGTHSQGLVVGYDTRFLSKEFADTVASVCTGNGIKVYLCDNSAPTPVVSFNVLHQRAAGAAIITASHNPSTWNGFKFKPEYAGSATQEITDRLETKIEAAAVVKTLDMNIARNQGLIVDFDPAPPYLDKIRSLINLPAIKKASLKVVVDAMFGAGAGYISTLISGGNTTVEELHGYRNPAFPGMEQPEPIAHNLQQLASHIPTQKASIGIALDGDADRVGVMDENGKFISTLEVFSLLALYLLDVKGVRGDLVKGVTSSMMLNKLGEQFGINVHEERIGFKYIGPKMSEIDALLGGEESGGFAFRGHIPERDGILSALYILEYMTLTGNSPSKLVANLFKQVGPHYYERRDVEFQVGDKERIHERITNPDLKQLASMQVLSADEIDGRRLIFEDGWLASRFSGTEPLLRIYCEANSPQMVTKLLDAAAEYLNV